MSPDHEETIRGYYDAVDAEDYDAVCDCFAPDIVYERPGQQAIEGIDALEMFYREERPLSEGSHTLHGVHVDGDTVAVRGSFEGVQNGDRVAFGFADFHELDEQGRIHRRYTYTDRDTV